MPSSPGAASLEDEQGEHRVGEAHPQPGHRPADGGDEDRGRGQQDEGGDADAGGDERGADATSARRIPVVAARAWSHDPEAQVTAAADRAIPPSVTVPPRSSTTVSGTNASVPKKANVTAKAATATDGRPAWPGAGCRRAAGAAGAPSPSQAPTTASPIAGSSEPIGERGQQQCRADRQAERVDGASGIAPCRIARPHGGSEAGQLRDRRSRP